MFVTIEIDADIAFTSVDVADDAEIYCTAGVTLMLFCVFNTNDGSEPVPFSNILIILLKLDEILLANDFDTAIEELYCSSFVILTKPSTFLTKDGNEPVFAKIFNTTSKFVLDALINVEDIDEVDTNCG